MDGSHKFIPQSSPQYYHVRLLRRPESDRANIADVYLISDSVNCLFQHADSYSSITVFST